MTFVRSARACFVLSLLLLTIASPLAARQKTDPDEGTLSSGKPHVPEPMVFDLVRPLGAEKGELEVNALFGVNLTGQRRLEWAPEVEFAFLEGYGFEFELPIENMSIRSLKFAGQGTIGTFLDGKAIHGWQVIVKPELGSKDLNLDFLHLSGGRWSHRWSTFTMMGARREQKMSSPKMAPLWNQSVFYHASMSFTLGLESNWKGHAAHGSLMAAHAPSALSANAFQHPTWRRSAEASCRPDAHPLVAFHP